MAAPAGVFQPRERSSSKLTTVFDAEGREIQAEYREDEEQNVKLNETIDLLLAAGYFRARIKGLSPFDKVVGGLTWCITTCNFDVDVDLLFQENSSIGQKIALTEKIVAVLPRMKCPHRIEPHQIQGMDFIHIYPVVQWLVKMAIETREEMGDYNRKFSVSQFNKYNSMPEDRQFQQSGLASYDIINKIKSTYGPKRKFRRPDALLIKDEETRVQSTLLEYGRHYGMSKSVESVEGKSKNKQQTEASHEQQMAVEEQRIQALLGSMTEASGQQNRLAASVVGSMVVMQSEEIKKASDEYAMKQAELEKHIDKPGTPQYYKKMATTVQKQIGEKRSGLDRLEAVYCEKKDQYSILRDKLEQLVSLESQIGEEMAKLESEETEENKIVLENLRALVTVNDAAKKKEQEYKQECKEELAKLEKEIECLASSATLDQDDEERSAIVEGQHEADRLKLQKMKLSLARRNREIASLQRRIDDVPSRAELSQYQRRFVELYNQVAATHKETKQFYTLYNTLDKSKVYLEKEVGLLNSIYDNFQTGMSSPGNREQFLKQFEVMVEGVKVSRAKAEKLKQQEKMKRDRLNDAYLDLLEKQRLYFKTIKEFKEECRKNEILLAKLSETEQ